MRWMAGKILRPVLLLFGYAAFVLYGLGLGVGHAFYYGGAALSIVGKGGTDIGVVSRRIGEASRRLSRRVGKRVGWALWLPFWFAGNVFRKIGNASGDLGRYIGRLSGKASRRLFGHGEWFLNRIFQKFGSASRLFWSTIGKACTKIGTWFRRSANSALRILGGTVRLFWRIVGGVFSRIGKPFIRHGKILKKNSEGVFAVSGTIRKFGSEVLRYRARSSKLDQDLAEFVAEQLATNPLDPNKQTLFLIITCGQAVRNFLLSDVLNLLRARFNVIIISPYAYSQSFREEYCGEGVHVIPWFDRFRTVFERFFEYYFMTRSQSRTHHSWLANLELRAKIDRTHSLRFQRLLFVKKLSERIGGLLGRRGMQGLYGSYYMAHLPSSLFRRLFSSYRPALVISTASYHSETWPLTYFARRQGCKTLANVLSWDNTTTKVVMDISCEHYAVWSEEMRNEFHCQFPHIKAKVTVTGCPMFDLYYNRPHAMTREAFLNRLGLSTEKPYILYTTNTPLAMPDEDEIISQYWRAIKTSPLRGKVSLLVRLHPKDQIKRYKSLVGQEDIRVTMAGQPHWRESDHWLPGQEDMRLLLNSMLHAAVSVNVASTMSLESFAVGLPTINVSFRSRPKIKDRGTKWSFDMYHFSEHYHALVEHGAVDIARSLDELMLLTNKALEGRVKRRKAMRRALEQKASYCDGTAAQRFVGVVETIVGRQAKRTSKPRLALQPAREEPVGLPAGGGIECPAM